jgi:hypothetical protein
LQDLRRRVFSVLRDSEKSFTEDQDVEDLLNEAYLDLTARLRLLRKEATGTTSSTGTVALPTDFIEPVWFSVLPSSSSDNHVVVEFTDDAVFDSWRLSESEPSNVLGRIYNGTIETYPVVVSLAYTLRYVYTPTTLDSVGDSPLIPAELQVRMVNYARAHCKYKEGEMAEGDRYLSMYEDGLPTAPLGARRERPGPFNLTLVPGVFDE